MTMTHKHDANDHMPKLIYKILDQHKAENITTIALEGRTILSDYMMICTATSSRHIAALCDYICQGIRDAGLGKPYVEGADSTNWSVIDAGDVIIHIFTDETRQLYNLEHLWGVPSQLEPS